MEMILEHGDLLWLAAFGTPAAVLVFIRADRRVDDPIVEITGTAVVLFLPLRLAPRSKPANWINWVQLSKRCGLPIADRVAAETYGPKPGVLFG